MSVLLVGDATPDYTVATNIANVEEAFRYTAVASGTLNELRFKTSSSVASDATSVKMGVYADAAGAPGALLGSGTYTGVPPVDAWIGVTGLSVAITSGDDYWLTVVPVGGTLQYQSAVSSGGTDDWISDDPFTSLQDPWPGTSSGNKFDDGPVGFQGLASVAPVGQLEWQVTGLWYPEATTVPYYGQIADPQDGSVDIPLNDSRTARVSLSVFDPMVADLVGHAYARCLRVYYNGRLIFWGPIILVEVNLTDGVVTLDAMDPSVRLIHHFARRGDLAGALDAANQDRATVTIDSDGLRLLRDAGINTTEQTDRGVPDLGIIDGTASTAHATDLMGVARGDQVWNTMLSLSETLGPDFELEPIDDTVGAYCRLNAYDTQGSDISDQVAFHWGTGRDNVESLSFTEGSKYTTHVHVLDRDSRYRVTPANLATSADTGPYVDWDVTDYDATGVPSADALAVLTAYGQDVLQAYSHPLRALDLTLPIETEQSQTYLADFIPGDIVGVAGRGGYGELPADTYRITKVSIAQQDAGTRTTLAVVASHIPPSDSED